MPVPFATITVSPVLVTGPRGPAGPQGPAGGATGPSGPPGPAGPVDTTYTDAQVAALQTEITGLQAQLVAMDALVPPSFDFTRPSVAGTPPYIIRS